MNKFLSILIALSCLITSTVSSRMLGVGMWFWIILASGAFVGISQFLPVLVKLGGAVASLMATLSLIAVVLTLLAATTGGSFELGGSEALLVFSFAMIALSGFILARRAAKTAGQQIPEPEETRHE